MAGWISTSLAVLDWIWAPTISHHVFTNLLKTGSYVPLTYESIFCRTPSYALCYRPGLLWKNVCYRLTLRWLWDRPARLCLCLCSSLPPILYFFFFFFFQYGLIWRGSREGVIDHILSRWHYWLIRDDEPCGLSTSVFATCAVFHQLSFLLLESKQNWGHIMCWRFSNWHVWSRQKLGREDAHHYSCAPLQTQAGHAHMQHLRPLKWVWNVSRSDDTTGRSFQASTIQISSFLNGRADRFSPHRGLRGSIL